MTGGYVSALSFVVGAAQAFDLRLDTETFERWKRGCSSMFYIDNAIDNSNHPEDVVQDYTCALDSATDMLACELLFHNEALLGKNPDLITGVVLLNNSVREMFQEKLGILKDSARKIGRIALAKQKTSNVDTYIAILNEEAIRTASIVTGTAKEFVAEQENFNIFGTLIRRALRCATFGDSCIDLSEDYKESITAVRPTVGNHAKLLARTIEVGWSMVQKAPHRKATLQALATRLAFGENLKFR